MNTAIETTTTTALSTCCYKGCNATATDHDCDGDEACALHAAQSERYEIATDLDPETSTWCTRQIADRVEALLAADGWTVSIREPRGGEAEGTYPRSSNGDLQILGFSIPTPDALSHAVTDAWNRATSAPAPIKTHIAITDSTGECQTYPVDTAEQRAAARAALRAVNERHAPVYAGEPDGAGDSHRNGEVLYADERADDRVTVVADEEHNAEAFWAALPDALRDSAHDLTAAQVAVVRGLLDGGALRGVECSRADANTVTGWAMSNVAGYDDGPAHARFALHVRDAKS